MAGPHRAGPAGGQGLGRWDLPGGPDRPEVRGARRRTAITDAARDGADLADEPAHLVRVIEYDVPDREGNGTGELIVVLSTITDPAAARADELAAAYHQRLASGSNTATPRAGRLACR